MPQIYMIGGPNGSGKTTSAMDLLPELLNCYEYVNADSIASALSPFSPESTAIQAGRLMLDRIHQLADKQKDFAFETTMASRKFTLSLVTQPRACNKTGT
jgi:predicted ABC-type ATPase